MTNTYMLAVDVAPGDIVAGPEGRYLCCRLWRAVRWISPNGKFVFSLHRKPTRRNGSWRSVQRGHLLIGDGATALTADSRHSGNDPALDPGNGNCASGPMVSWVAVLVLDMATLYDLFAGGLTAAGAAGRP